MDQSKEFSEDLRDARLEEIFYFILFYFFFWACTHTVSIADFTCGARMCFLGEGHSLAFFVGSTCAAPPPGNIYIYIYILMLCWLTGLLNAGTTMKIYISSVKFLCNSM